MPGEAGGRRPERSILGSAKPPPLIPETPTRRRLHVGLAESRCGKVRRSRLASVAWLAKGLPLASTSPKLQQLLRSATRLEN
jgi:hypothetical protein